MRRLLSSRGGGRDTAMLPDGLLLWNDNLQENPRGPRPAVGGPAGAWLIDSATDRQRPLDVQVKELQNTFAHLDV